MTPAELRELLAAEDVAPIPGCPGYYVTRQGGVFSTAHNWRGYGTRLLTPLPDDDGYQRVRASVEGRRVVLRVHRLVADAFLPPRPTPQHEVRHLDGNPQNNDASNLAWGTRKENAADRERHGRTARGINNAMYRNPEMSGRAKLSGRIPEVLGLLRSGLSQSEVARRVGVKPTTICSLVNGRTWSALLRDGEGR